MKKTVSAGWIVLSILLFLSCHGNNSGKAPRTITLSGVVRDFDGNSIDSSVVEILGRNFTVLYETYTDTEGRYSLEIPAGRYMAMYVIRPKEYPRMNAVPEEEMRLEFWAWNIIGDRDLEINPRYEKLELYGTTVFEVFGGYPGLFVYFRPMSVTKIISLGKNIYLDKETAEESGIDISVKPEHLKVKVFADEEPLKINSIHHVEEFGGDGKTTITGYVLQVDKPERKLEKPYIIFRVEAENTEQGEKGESIYFYETPHFK